MKKYNIVFGVGKSKYVVCYHDSQKFHSDGSPFFDIKIFKNQKDLNDFTQSLLQKGYKYEIK